MQSLTDLDSWICSFQFARKIGLPEIRLVRVTRFRRNTRSPIRTKLGSREPTANDNNTVVVREKVDLTLCDGEWSNQVACTMMALISGELQLMVHNLVVMPMTSTRTLSVGNECRTAGSSIDATTFGPTATGAFQAGGAHNASHVVKNNIQIHTQTQ